MLVMQIIRVTGENDRDAAFPIIEFELHPSGSWFELVL
jgi:hypothetical protein